MRVLSWLLQLTVAVILGQTLFFKFTGAPESVFIFSTLGAEPWGRIGSGLVELATVVLLLVPRTAAVGALAGVGIGAGAIASHLAFLGVEVQGDGGLLFTLACVVLLGSLGTLALRWRELVAMRTLLTGTTM